MTEAAEPVLGVCSWSLQPRSPQDLAEKVRAVGLTHVQLALDPLRTGAWSATETVATLRGAGIDVRSGMVGTVGEDYSTLESIARTGGVRPAEHWAENLAAFHAAADLARRLGLSLVTFHAGFLPHDPADPERATMIERLRASVDAFAERGVAVGLETGQEDAETLLGVLAALERPTCGVNFDPANMVLYDMGDPVEALRRLAPFVKQVHVKDALRTRRPGTWGAEVRAGTGDVDWGAFFELLNEERLRVDLMIEREAGDDRLGDIRAARELVERQQREWVEERGA